VVDAVRQQAEQTVDLGDFPQQHLAGRRQLSLPDAAGRRLADERQTLLRDPASDIDARPFHQMRPSAKRSWESCAHAYFRARFPFAIPSGEDSPGRGRISMLKTGIEVGTLRAK